MQQRHVARWELDGIDGAVVVVVVVVVVVDVIRGVHDRYRRARRRAAAIHLVGTIDEALQFERENPGALAMGEERGLCPSPDWASPRM